MSPGRESRPALVGNRTASISTAIKTDPSLRSSTHNLRDLDALAEHLRGVYVLQLVVDNAGHRRSYFYKNLDAAQRAVKRAADRGRHAHLTLVQMVPVGVIGGGLG